MPLATQAGYSLETEKEGEGGQWQAAGVQNSPAFTAHSAGTSSPGQHPLGSAR